MNNQMDPVVGEKEPSFSSLSGTYSGGPDESRKMPEPGVSFFHPTARPYTMKAIKRIGLTLILMAFLTLGIFSIYWGSMYKRNSRLKNLKMLVVVGDEGEIGTQFSKYMRTPESLYAGDWKIVSEADFLQDAGERTTEEELFRVVHEQHYWYAFYVKTNATARLKEAIDSGNTSYNVSNESIIGYYETGRDFATMGSNIVPAVQKVISIWSTSVSPQVMHKIADGSSSILVSYPITPTTYDWRPLRDTVITAPAQFGNIYLIILSFFSFSLFAEVHQNLGKLRLNPIHYLVYRYLTSISAYLVISLFIGFVSLAMQIDFTPAFGRAGFVVYWMTTFLTCTAVGLANDIMCSLAVLYRPELLGFWLLFWVVINVSPTFAALAVLPKFFRFGYGLPIHNSYEVIKVVLFDTWRGDLGRSFGVLVAWCALLSILQPLVVALFGKTMAERQMKAQKEV